MAVPAVSKSERAYEFLLQQLAEGSLTPGHRLVLGHIAEQLNCSVVPVREAVRRLEAEGLVTFQRNVGATVQGVDTELMLHTMETLSVIEGAATALAAGIIPAADIAAARKLNAAMRCSLADFSPVEFTAMNTQFHAILYSHCPNPHILDLVQRGWVRLNSIRSSTFVQVPQRAHESVAEHDALLDLIDSKAPLHTIERAARNHRLNTLNAYLNQQQQPPSLL